MPAGAQTGGDGSVGGSPFGETYYLPYFAAEQGFFARNGVKAEFSNFTGGTLITQAVLANALEVGQCDVLSAANAHNRGFSLGYFAGGGIYDSTNATTKLCTLPDSPIRTAKELEGQAVGVPVLASISGLGVMAWLVSNGAVLSKVKLYELTYSSMVQAMQRKDLAEALIGEPNLGKVQTDKSVRILAHPYDAVAKNFMISGTFATRAWIEANLDTARKLARALDDTVKWANTHQVESAPIVAKGTGIPLETVSTMARAKFAQLDARYVQPVGTY